jgi:hypothetical protein
LRQLASAGAPMRGRLRRSFDLQSNQYKVSKIELSISMMAVTAARGKQ